MKIIANRMQVNMGQEAEYKRRHDEIWPELSQLLKEHGIHEYRIFLDEETCALFAILMVENPDRLIDLPSNPIMQKWWAYMKDIMPSNSDFSPVSTELKEVFYLP
ncbi:MAG: L-rhamnose mutarotase [Acinetobacter bereziniae]|uniref:L-rhamnose mutarotase n=1 Tax=Acinetobacter bereziniae TaxID=106648 RepID=A0A833TUQ9_ACIBZ|nr:MAG: L-rhamnose mutarotase [Acinetobacter bereziniae]